MEPFPEAPRLRTVADYQFGAGAGAALFPSGTDLRVTRSTSDRVQQVHADAGRVVTFAGEGRFTLGLEGGHRLAAALASPACRVVVGDESDPYVREGRNAFAKFVREADPAVRPGDEVVVEGPAGALLAVGRAELSATAMTDFERGVAVSVREGNEADGPSPDDRD